MASKALAGHDPQGDFREGLKYCAERLARNESSIIDRQTRRPAVPSQVVLFEISKDMEELAAASGRRELKALQRDFDELQDMINENEQANRWWVPGEMAETLDECFIAIHPEINTQ